MLKTQDPKWLARLSRRMQWLAIPNIAVLLITLQILGFFSVMSDGAWFDRLALLPERVLQGEIWRLLTFLALPLSHSPIWMIFALWFLYFILNTIESEWGAFKTTLYVLVSIVVSIVYSLTTGYPVTAATDFVSTLFLAAAALFPNFEIRLYFLLPVKMKWLAWLSVAFLVLRLAQTSWLGRFHLIAIYSNFLFFFGPALISQLKQWHRRTEYRRKLRN